ncbi:PKD domain-containing protein [Acanthopleuribacter pedis]|uniref:PKD domain-containing protein n=1 Tax=Acanthopleuribacter pedis TaxID=442870 RepID=A0A8J7QI98_9BACT|nr:PKD domain-containing protein [Acanthopleuribacter pedis]MBO1318743.1 PKD domain-containing protein [Acanthopleuribacter pedis]
MLRFSPIFGSHTPVAPMRYLFLAFFCFVPLFAVPPKVQILSPASDFSWALGVPITFLVTADQTNLTYNWTLSNGETLTGENPSYTPTEAGPLTFTLTATNSAGEVSQPDDRIIFVYVPDRFFVSPVIESIQLSANAVIDGQTLFAEATVTDADSDPPFAYHWFWLENGVAQRSNETVAAITPNLSQDFAVPVTLTLVVVDTEGNPSFSPGFSSFQVLPQGSNLPPRATILEPSEENIRVLKGSEVTFRAEASDPEGDTPISLTWHFPDLTSSTDNPARYQFNEAGTFAVRLEAVDARGNQDPARNTVIVEVLDESGDEVRTGTIFQPLFSTRIATGESLILNGVPSGTASQQGKWRITNALTGEVIGQLDGDRPGRFPINQTGLYEVFYFFEEFGRESAKTVGNVRWVAVHDRDTNASPKLNYVGDFQRLVKNGEPIEVSVTVEDENPETLTFYWILDGILQAPTRQPTFQTTFNLEPDVFHQGISERRIEVTAVDAQGKVTDVPLLYDIRVYPDRIPPRLSANNLTTGSTLYVPVGESLELDPQIDNPDNLELTYSWRASYSDAITELILDSDQRVPPPTTFSRFGLADIQFNAVTPDQSQRAAVAWSLWVQTYRPDHPPTTTITKPRTETLTIEPNHPLTFEGFTTEPNFISGNPNTNFQRIKNQMRWVITLDGSAYASYQQNEPLTVTFTEQGTYQVTLQTTNSLGLNASEPDTVTIQVVPPRPDESFEPNDVREQASALDLGHYSGISLGPEDSGDWYRFNLPTDRATLDMELDLRNSEDGLEVEIYRGDTLIHRDSLAAGAKHPFSFHGGQAGEYFLFVGQPPGKTLKRMLSFGFTVSVSQPRLTFAYPKTDEIDQTTLSLVNPSNAAARVTLAAHGNNGQNLAEHVFEIPANGVLENAVDLLFPDAQTLDIGWVQVLSDQKIEGLAITLGRDRETAVAETGVTGTLDSLILPHIAQETGQWFTQAAVVNGSGETLDTAFHASAGRFTVDGLAGKHQSRLLDFETFFGGSLPPSGSEWGRFVEQQANAALTGVELFGTKTGSPRICALNLSSNRTKNPNFVFQGNDIYFPHVAEDTNSFWTGIAFVNDADFTTQVLLTAYDRSGAILSQQPITMAANGKEVGLAPSFFPDLAAGTKISWIRLQTEGNVHGYALFGDNDGDNTQLAGFPAATGGARELMFPKVDFVPGETFTGLAVVNLSNQNTATLTYEAFGADGTLLGTSERNIGPLQKDVALVERLFGGTLPAGTSWVRLVSTEPLAGFQLMGRLDGKYLAATLAQ